jgi:hypothetical protein
MAGIILFTKIYKRLRMKAKEYIRARIDSAKRLNPSTETTSNFTYSLNENTKRVTGYIIESITIPFTFYEINSSNNVITFNNGATTITIPPGHYTASSFTTTLKGLMDIAFGDSTTTVSYSDSTYKLTIARGTPFIVDSYISVPASTGSGIIGFNVSSTNSTTNTGDSTINISGPTHVNIASAYLTNYLSNKMRFVDNTYSNVLLSIPILIQPGNDITLVNNMPVSIVLSGKFDIMKNDIIDISIRDPYNNVLDFNGRNIVIDIIFVIE